MVLFRRKKITYEELFQCKNSYVLTTVPWMCTYEECAHMRNKFIVKRNKFIVKTHNLCVDHNAYKLSYELYKLL